MATEIAMGYVGLERCGCLSLLVTDRGEAVADAADEIRSLRRRGGTLNHETIEECRGHAWRCPEHEVIHQQEAALAARLAAAPAPASPVVPQ